MTFQTLQYDVNGHLATLTSNRSTTAAATYNPAAISGSGVSPNVSTVMTASGHAGNQLTAAGYDAKCLEDLFVPHTCSEVKVFY